MKTIPSLLFLSTTIFISVMASAADCKKVTQPTPKNLADTVNCLIDQLNAAADDSTVLHAEVFPIPNNGTGITKQFPNVTLLFAIASAPPAQPSTSIGAITSPGIATSAEPVAQTSDGACTITIKGDTVSAVCGRTAGTGMMYIIFQKKSKT